MSGWFGDTLALYGRVFRQAAERAAANWPLAALAAGYPMLLALLARVLGPYGILGGFVLTAAAAACFSSWLHFMEQVVRRGRADADVHRLDAELLVCDVDGMPGHLGARGIHELRAPGGAADRGAPSRRLERTAVGSRVRARDRPRAASTHDSGCLTGVRRVPALRHPAVVIVMRTWYVALHG